MHPSHWDWVGLVCQSELKLAGSNQSGQTNQSSPLLTSQNTEFDVLFLCQG